MWSHAACRTTTRTRSSAPTPGSHHFCADVVHVLVLTCLHDHLPCVLCCAGQALKASSAPDLRALAKPPAELAAWLGTAQEGLWRALWQPLLDFREEMQVCCAGLCKPALQRLAAWILLHPGVC